MAATASEAAAEARDCAADCSDAERRDDAKSAGPAAAAGSRWPPDTSHVSVVRRISGALQLGMLPGPSTTARLPATRDGVRPVRAESSPSSLSSPTERRLASKSTPPAACCACTFGSGFTAGASPGSSSRLGAVPAPWTLEVWAGCARSSRRRRRASADPDAPESRRCSLPDCSRAAVAGNCCPGGGGGVDSADRRCRTNRTRSAHRASWANDSEFPCASSGCSSCRRRASSISKPAAFETCSSSQPALSSDAGESARQEAASSTGGARAGVRVCARPVAAVGGAYRAETIAAASGAGTPAMSRTQSASNACVPAVAVPSLLRSEASARDDACVPPAFVIGPVDADDDPARYASLPLCRRRLSARVMPDAPCVAVESGCCRSLLTCTASQKQTW
mmetsp:Transcript_43253/g.133623  ORF Transcript_43253/g.133623 Transcript_43253/m.133623 type:complete len:394 (+) Transcript_43253:534-1715(+)